MSVFGNNNSCSIQKKNKGVVNTTSFLTQKEDSAYESFCRMFTVFVVIYPIFNRYQSVVPFLTISELTFLLLFIVAAIRFKVFTFRIEWMAIALSAYLLFDIFLHAEELSGTAMAQGAGTAARVALLYLLFAFMSRNFIDFDYGVRALVFVSILISLYGLVQMAASHLGIALTTYIPGLPIMGEGNLDAEVREKMAYGLTFRMQSILNEPAALCCYLILPITMLLNSEGEIGRSKELALFFSSVCVLSLSSTGIIVVLVLWGFYALRSLLNRNIDARILALGTMAAIAGLVVVLTCTDIWSYFMTRTFGNAGLSGLSEGTRFYALNTALSASDSPFNVLFGVLTAQTEDYLPGFARAYYLYGFCGLILTVLIMFVIARRGNKLSRWVVAIFAFLNVGTEIMLGNFTIYYLCFASAAGKKEMQGHVTCREGLPYRAFRQS